MQGSSAYGPVWSLAPSFRAQVNIFWRLRDIGPPFPAPSIPVDAIPALFHSVGQEFPSPAEFRRSLKDCFVPIQLQKTSEGFEQFVSKWYFYLCGNAQTFQHRLYFCINSKWMISYPWIKSLGMMMVKLALYWWCPCSVSPSLCQHGSESPLWMFQHPCHLMQLSLVSQDRWLHPKQINSFWGATQRGFIYFYLYFGYACKHTAAQQGDLCAHQGENRPWKVPPHIQRPAERMSRRNNAKLSPALGLHQAK